MALFFIIFFTVYGAAHFYLFRRLFQALPAMPDWVKGILIATLIISALSYIIAKALLAQSSGFFYNAFLWVGSFWFSISLYGILFCLLVDAFRLLHFIGLKVGLVNSPLPSVLAFYALIAGLIFIAGMNVYGFLHASKVKTKTLELALPGKGAKRSMKILYFSDTHLTAINDGRIMNQILRVMNEEQPDLILMGGDVVDDKPFRLKQLGIDSKLRQFKAPYGVFTCPGNHEYITGYANSEKFLVENGITVLRDSAIVVAGALNIMGRDDLSGERFWHTKRKSLAELKSNIKNDFPIILLDHQPFGLAVAQKENIGLQLSGHTHHGQMFPANLITKKIYEQSWGYLRKGATHFYVSSGAGTWGPPVRIGSDSEVLIINLTY